jgi:spore coat polysaccharide biosynthesis protein SpsF
MSDKVLAIVQARLGSSRLPCKILLPLGSETVIERVYRSLLKSKEIDHTTICIPNDEEENVLEEFLETREVSFYRGEMHDVLDRFASYSNLMEYKYVVRITSDCPFISIDVIDSSIKLIKQNPELDYVSNTLERTFPRGLDCEVFTVSALMRAQSEAVSISDREHVTPYIWRNGGTFNIGQIKDNEDLSDIRLTLDTIEDYLSLSTMSSIIIRSREENLNYLQLKKIIKKYRSEITRFNSSIEQKEAQ